MSKTLVFTDENTPSSSVWCCVLCRGVVCGLCGVCGVVVWCETLKKPVCPLKHIPICTFKSPSVYRHHAHMFQHMCALCRHTRGRTTPQHRTHHTDHTPHHDTRHNTTRRQTETDRDRDRGRRGDEREDDKTRAERREKSEEREDSFSVWWCMAVFYWCCDFAVNSVCARDFSLINSVQ